MSEPGEVCDEGVVGEIWIQGASVASHYWHQPAEGQGARVELKGEAGLWLRTGDLGFVREGELFPTGRLSDLLIVRGHNHHPQDLEQSAGAAHPSLRSGFAAAFALEGQGTEDVLLVQEVKRDADREELEGARRAVLQAVASEQGVRLKEVLFVRFASLPLTTSGKIRRGACREAYQDGALREIKPLG